MGLLVQRFFARFCALVLKIYYDEIVVRGEHNCPEGPLILAANHPNMLMVKCRKVCLLRKVSFFFFFFFFFQGPSRHCDLYFVAHHVSVCVLGKVNVVQRVSRPDSVAVGSRSGSTSARFAESDDAAH
jgi:hypothetical protein